MMQGALKRLGLLLQEFDLVVLREVYLEMLYLLGGSYLTLLCLLGQSRVTRALSAESAPESTTFPN